MTCATTGRPEHGTARTDPASSPLTVEAGWNYYKNLREGDFSTAVDISPVMCAHQFWTNWNHYDLLFVGIKGTEPLTDEMAAMWRDTLKAVNGWLAVESGGRVHRYRATMASTFGEVWFTTMNKIRAVMNWLHEVR